MGHCMCNSDIKTDTIFYVTFSKSWQPDVGVVSVDPCNTKNIKASDEHDENKTKKTSILQSR